jgi:hypothetical protein
MLIALAEADSTTRAQMRSYQDERIISNNSNVHLIFKVGHWGWNHRRVDNGVFFGSLRG